MIKNTTITRRITSWGDSSRRAPGAGADEEGEESGLEEEDGVDAGVEARGAIGRGV